MGSAPVPPLPCGHVLLDDELRIHDANAEFLALVGLTRAEALDGRALPDLVSVGGRILFDTHLVPLLRTQGRVREISLDLLDGRGGRTAVLLNATRVQDAEGVGRVRAIVVEFRDRKRFEDDMRAAIRLAEVARAQADELAETLQRTLIPPSPPLVPHLDIAAAYRPAGDGRQVGGDFYDVFQVGPEDWVVALGDVSGKGVLAATVTTSIRFELRALAVRLSDPSEVLAELHQIMWQGPRSHFCTLVLVRLARDAAGWELRVSLAGHPAPLLRTPEGEVVEVGVYGSSLGLLEEAVFHTVTRRLDGPLVLYTDGVTEARGESGMYGEHALIELLAEVPGDAAAVTDAVVDAVLAFQHGDAADDIAVVCLAPLP